MSAKLKNKSIAFYIECGAGIVALIALIIFFVYSGSNGSTNIWVILNVFLGIAATIAIFFANDKIADIIAIFPAIFYMVAAGESLHSGVGNIVDAMQGIVMFGNKDLATTNYIMAVLFIIACVACIVASFLPKSKATAK